VDAAELIEAVRAVGRRAADAGNDGDALRRAAGEIDDLVSDPHQAEWLAHTDVLMELGYTLGNLEQFDAAVHYLRKALEVDGMNSTLTFRAVELLANYEARLAGVVGTNPDRAEEMRQSAITRLRNLIAISESAERYSMLGSAYKRVAVAETDAVKARTALAQASQAYSQAHEHNLHRQTFDTYPVLNWVTVAFVLGEPVPDADELLDRCDSIVAERFADDHSFFNALGIAESRLVRILRRGGLGEQGEGADAELAAIESLFRQVIAGTAPNGRELNSVYTQIDSICSLLQKLSGERASTAVTISRLTQLRQSIGAEAHVVSAAEYLSSPS
jgi:tetratricopeptide (TPR) repeat protein